MNINTNEQMQNEIRRIFKIFKTSEGALRPHFILTGPSGSGKTHIMESMSSECDLSMVEINAAQLTKEGTAGNSLSKALVPLLSLPGKPVICFVDEFDKLFISGNNNSELAHEVTNGVQNEFLKVLESKTTSVFGDFGKYLETDISRVLFIFAGAFNGEEDITLDKLRMFGVKTEFLGRVGLAYGTKKYSLEYMLQILRTSELLNSYLQLMPKANREHAISTISEYISISYENNTIGARLINTLIHQYFIKGGVLNADSVKKIAFQKTIDLN